jgi:hypothetical protein
MTDDIAQTFGYIILFVLVILCFYKKLRDNRRLGILLIATSLIAIYACVLKTSGQAFSGRFRGSDFLFSPFIFVLTYAILRYLYKDVYDREPTYDRTSWYDSDERRYQNFFDVIVFVFPLLFSITFPIWISFIWP